jgi:hypothetical protein
MIMNRCFIIFATLFLAASAPALAQERCGTAKDYVVQAREKARPGLSRLELQEQRQQLKRATDFCPTMGDAYYYRYLYAEQLGNATEARYFLGKARENGSEALNYGSNPFAAPTEGDGRIATSPVVREKWALVVGISNFRHRVAPLKFPAKDAKDFYTLLRHPQYGHFKTENTKMLIDEGATTQGIKEGLNWLARNAHKDDLVVVFISSHGSPREMDTGGVNYLITYDTDPSNQDRIYGTALEMVEIVEALSTRVKAQRGVLFLDTCFSGAAALGVGTLRHQSTATPASGSNLGTQGGTSSKALTAEGAGVANASLDRIRYSLGRVVIAASQPDERSWESEKLQNGYFTYYLIEGLKQNNGGLSVEQLYTYLKDRVPRQVIADKGVSQTPLMLPIKPNVDISLGVITKPH